MTTGEPSSGQTREELYAHTAELMKAGSSRAEIVGKLMRKGLDYRSASTVVAHLSTLHARALVEVGRRNIVRGALWCTGGIIVTAATYFFAGPGGSYIIAWGAVLFGAKQFYDGVRQSGPEGHGTASCSVVLALLLLTVLFMASVAVSGCWGTYTDETTGFSVRYPLLWQAEVEKNVAETHVSFRPRYGWRPDYRRLDVICTFSPMAVELTSRDYLFILEEMAQNTPGATIDTARGRYIHGRPGAEIAFEAPLPGVGQNGAFWFASCGTERADFLIGANDAGGDTDTLEPFYTRFVESFRFLHGR